MKTRTLKTYVDTTFGFPVKLSNVKLMAVGDDWAPIINYPQLDLRVLGVLSRLHRPLSGAEVRFVRQHHELTQAAFAAKFGVSHVAVHKWEKRGNQPTGMGWSTEKDLRLFIVSGLSKDPKAVGLLYAQLTEQGAPKPAARATALSLA
ncbi:MAG: helix-turn-helix domain-containing protein [Desulfobaccales bacterium]